MAVGILALQGAFAEHAAMLDRLGVEHFEIRKASDLSNPMDHLILPGGESTVMNKLLHALDLYQPLKDRIEAGMPVFGTCAGMILLAKNVEDGNPCFATMDIDVLRNAYGRQLGSFHTESAMDSLGDIPMTFIRAPYAKSVGNDAKVLATVDGRIVAARQNNQLVTAFHPELDDSTAVHEYFLNM